MSGHPEPAGDWFKGFSLLVDAFPTPPPQALMDERAVGWIHQAHNAVVDGTAQHGGNMEQTVMSRKER